MQLLVSVLRKRTWRHELQQLDAADKVAPRGCEHFAGLPPTAAACHDGTVCRADCLLQLWRRVNVQLGGGGAPTVHMDADSSWNPKSSEEGGSVGIEAGGGVALRGWRARIVQALTLAAVAMCLWALVESILSTHGSAQKFWDIIDDAERQVSSVDASRSGGLRPRVCSAALSVAGLDLQCAIAAHNCAALPCCSIGNRATDCMQLGSVLATSQALLQATKDIRSAFLVLWWRTTAGAPSSARCVAQCFYVAARHPDQPNCCTPPLEHL